MRERGRSLAGAMRDELLYKVHDLERQRDEIDLLVLVEVLLVEARRKEIGRHDGGEVLRRHAVLVRVRHDVAHEIEQPREERLGRLVERLEGLHALGGVLGLHEDANVEADQQRRRQLAVPLLDQGAEHMHVLALVKDVAVQLVLDAQRLGLVGRDTKDAIGQVALCAHELLAQRQQHRRNDHRAIGLEVAFDRHAELGRLAS